MKKYTVQVRVLGKLYKRNIEAGNERAAAELVKSDIWSKIVIETVEEKETETDKMKDIQDKLNDDAAFEYMMSMLGFR